MDRSENTPSPVRYSKRWKRWLGYYIVLSGAVGIGNEIPKTRPSLSVYLLLLVWTVWGFWWIVDNPRSGQGDVYVPGDASRPAGRRRWLNPKLWLTIVLLVILLMIYQTIFMTPPVGK